MGAMLATGAPIVANASASTRLADQLVLDDSFGTGGTVTTTFPSSYSGAKAVITQDDGRIVAAGFAHTDNSILSDFAITRYDAEGAPDAGFGANGLVRTDFGGRYDEALAVAAQPDGKIVVAGRSSDSTGSDMAVARYLSDGTLDPTFDGDGLALVDFGGESSASAVAVTPGGAVVLAGWATYSAGPGCCVSDFALARLTDTGAPDSSFGTNGLVLTDFLAGPDNGYDAAQAVLVLPDGRIVAAGSGVAGQVSVDFALARYLPDGSPDATFGGDGLVSTEFVGYWDEIRGLAIDSAGRVVAGGQSCEDPASSDEVCDFGLARYRADGTLDRRFGRSGKIRTDIGADIGEGVRGIAILADGRIVAGGETYGDGGRDVVLARYLSNGRLDSGSGASGIIIHSVSPATDEVGGLALDTAGAIVVAGTASVEQSFAFFVSRFVGSTP